MNKYLSQLKIIAPKVLFDPLTMRAWIEDPKGFIVELTGVRPPLTIDTDMHGRRINFDYDLGRIDTDRVEMISAETSAMLQAMERQITPFR